MLYLAAVLVLMFGEWILHPFSSGAVSWQISLGAKYFTVAIMWVLIVKLASKERLLVRSIIFLLCLDACVDASIYLVWQISGMEIDGSMPLFVSSTVGLIHLLLREYDIPNQKINKENVTILLLKPRNHIELIKAFFGAPVSSICIVADDCVWAFREKSGKYEKSKYSDAWLVKHTAIDTGVKCTEQIVSLLDKNIGEDRFPRCKCVFSIRDVLNSLGGKFVIRSWFDYIPGIYALSLMGK